MVDLALHEMRWSRDQGHPVLVLSISGQAKGAMSVVLSAGDAQLLAAKPPGNAAERLRLVDLFEELLRAMDGRLIEVHFHLDPGMILVAELCIETAERGIKLPASFADALALAIRSSAPMSISELDLRWIQAVYGTSADQPASETGATTLPSEISAFIESLQLDDLSGPTQNEISDRGM
jgi:bifunctional DNase/RNase